MIQLEGLAKHYNGPTGVVHALREATLDIQHGAFICIQGPSGSGKSTLLNLLGLLDTPSSGSYRLEDEEVQSLSDRRRTSLRGHVFGFVFQSFQLLSGLSAQRNVELGMLYLRSGREARRIRAHEALTMVGMSHRAQASVETLSGGEQQRVAIARAVASRARVLLCDEPTGNLDSRNASIVLDLMHDLNADGLTVVVVTHDPAVASRIPQRAHVRDGVLGAVQ